MRGRSAATAPPADEITAADEGGPASPRPQQQPHLAPEGSGVTFDVSPDEYQESEASSEMSEAEAMRVKAMQQVVATEQARPCSRPCTSRETYPRAHPRAPQRTPFVLLRT